MKIELTDQQARVLVNALDLYSRVNTGQLWALAGAIGSAKTKDGSEMPDNWSIREHHTDRMTSVLFGYAPNASHGICSTHVPQGAKVAYDLQCVIRRDVAERENHAGSSVWHGELLHVCRDVPLAKVTA